VVDADADGTALGLELSAHGPRSRFFTVCADRVDFADDRVTFIRAGEIVFQCARSALVSITPSQRAPRPAQAAREAQPDPLAPRHTSRSANTRWTAGDEAFLRERYAAGDSPCGRSGIPAES
jgi:hypothetical protein